MSVMAKKCHFDLRTSTVLDVSFYLTKLQYHNNETTKVELMSSLQFKPYRKRERRPGGFTWVPIKTADPNDTLLSVNYSNTISH